MRAAEVIDMSSARVNVVHMSKMIQIRNVPDEMHRALKVQAAEEGMTLSDYIKRELIQVTGQSTLDEISAWRRSRPPSGLTTQGIVDAIREVRGD
jgi:antitoxin FitA